MGGGEGRWGLIEDEEELQMVFENDDEPAAEMELNFSEDFHAENGGHIYESIEGEVGEAADAAATEELPDDPDFDEELPEEFFEGLNDALGG